MRTAESTAPTPIHPAVLWVGAAAAMSSGGALVVAILTERPLWFASTFVLVPGLIAFTALTVTVRRHQQTLFLQRTKAGVIGGILATGGYDVFRWIIEVTEVIHTRSFIAIRAFGAGLTSQPLDKTASLVAGWAFHFVNGIGFALAYTLIAAGRHWVLGVVFALGLETAMVLLYPTWLGITLSKEFLSVGILAHVIYGAILGRIAQRTR